MAGRALTGKVVGWAVTAVTTLAIGGPGGLVIEAGRQPAIGIMAGRTLALVMVGRAITAVTALAIGGPGDGVIKTGRQPVSG